MDENKSTKIPILIRVEESGTYYVRIDVVTRIYDLLERQAKFFRERRRSDLEWCKDVERSFKSWYENCLKPSIPHLNE